MMMFSDVMRNIEISGLDKHRTEVCLTNVVMCNVEISELDKRRYT